MCMSPLASTQNLKHTAVQKIVLQTKVAAQLEYLIISVPLASILYTLGCGGEANQHFTLAAAEDWSLTSNPPLVSYHLLGTADHILKYVHFSGGRVTALAYAVCVKHSSGGPRKYEGLWRCQCHAAVLQRAEKTGKDNCICTYNGTFISILHFAAQTCCLRWLWPSWYMLNPL